MLRRSMTRFETVRVAAIQATPVILDARARVASAFSGLDALWERLWQNSVEVPGPLVDRLVDACRERDLYCAIGINERELDRPGTLYNTMLLLGPSGILHR